MDWDQLKKKAAGMTVKAVAAATEEMGNRSRRLSMEQKLSSEKREELKRKSENYMRNSQRMKTYYNDTFGSKREDEE